jgi:hypothetical protein
VAASEGLHGSAGAGSLGYASCAAIPSHDKSCTERMSYGGKLPQQQLFYHSFLFSFYLFTLIHSAKHVKKYPEK